MSPLWLRHALASVVLQSEILRGEAAADDRRCRSHAAPACAAPPRSSTIAQHREPVTPRGYADLIGAETSVRIVHVRDGGVPVEGARVEVSVRTTNHTDNWGLRAARRLGVATTDREGVARVEIPTLSRLPDAFDLVVHTDLEGRVASYDRGISELYAGTVARLLEPSGAPAAGARWRDGTADEEGRITFPSPTGPNSVVISADGTRWAHLQGFRAGDPPLVLDEPVPTCRTFTHGLDDVSETFPCAQLIDRLDLASWLWLTMSQVAEGPHGTWVALAPTAEPPEVVTPLLPTMVQQFTFDDGTPIPGAPVRISRDLGSTYERVYTDFAGRVEVPVDPRGGVWASLETEPATSGLDAPRTASAVAAFSLPVPRRQTLDAEGWQGTWMDDEGPVDVSEDRLGDQVLEVHMLDADVAAISLDGLPAGVWVWVDGRIVWLWRKPSRHLGRGDVPLQPVSGSARRNLGLLLYAPLPDFIDEGRDTVLEIHCTDPESCVDVALLALSQQLHQPAKLALTLRRQPDDVRALVETIAARSGRPLADLTLWVYGPHPLWLGQQPADDPRGSVYVHVDGSVRWIGPLPGLTPEKVSRVVAVASGRVAP